MTDEVLKGLAAQALNMARTEFDLKGNFAFLLGYYMEALGGFRRMAKIEAQIAKTCGEDWLNKPAAKDAAFGRLREACSLIPPEAIVFVTVSNKFEPTAKFHALPEKRKKALWNAGHDKHHAAVRDGLFTVEDAFCVLAQTPEQFCVGTVAMNGDLKAPEFEVGPQEGFGGRLKMFGVQEATTGPVV